MFPQFVLKPKKKQGNLWTNLITIFVIGNVLKTKLYWTKPHFPLSIIMNYTLKQLQERVNKLIEVQGEDAQCAAWIYTREDVFEFDEKGDEVYFYETDLDLVNDVLADTGGSDYTYQIIQETIDDAINLRKNLKKQQELTEV